MSRIWKDVVGLEDRYEVSNDGLVRTKPRVLKAFAAPKGGHLQINLGSQRRTYVHRLVAEAFLGGLQAGLVVNHKNGVPGDNRVENLEWVTCGENIAHGYRSNGRSHYSRAPVAAFDAAGDVVARYASITDAAKAHGVAKGAIGAAIRRGGTSAGFRWAKT